MWLAEFIEIATKDSECMLSLQNREVDDLNTLVGEGEGQIMPSEMIVRHWSWLGIASIDWAHWLDSESTMACKPLEGERPQPLRKHSPSNGS